MNYKRPGVQLEAFSRAVKAPQGFCGIRTHTFPLKINKINQVPNCITACQCGGASTYAYSPPHEY